MLKKQIPEEFKAFFLLQFTKELIRNSLTTEIESEIDEKEKKDIIKERVKEVLKKESSGKIEELSEESIKMNFEPSVMSVDHHLPEIQVRTGQRQKPLMPMQKHPIHARAARKAPMHPRQMQKQAQKPALKPLRIPEPQLPKRLQYLHPTPTNREIDLGKLNPLINDPAVRTIQCDGDGSNIVVMGTMGMKSTGIVLTREEINDVIGRFSMLAKIPLQEEGIFRVVFGKFILSAIISDVIGPRFIIKKIGYSQLFGQSIGRLQMPESGLEPAQMQALEQERLQRQIFPRK